MQRKGDIHVPAELILHHPGKTEFCPTIKKGNLSQIPG